MESIESFRRSIWEIDFLIQRSIEENQNIQHYQLFNKLAVILLSTKIEVFLENFIDEHSTRILNGHTNRTISQHCKDIYFDNAVDLINSTNKRSNKRALFSSLLTLSTPDERPLNTIGNIRPSLKFSYGKHGSTEIRSLFERHGLKEFINSDDVKLILDKLNSMIAIRNNSIHQDATPSLTHQDVESHKENCLKFVDKIEQDIEAHKNLYYNET